MRAVILALASCAASAVGTASAQEAEVDPLAEGIELFERLHMDDARAALERALRMPGRLPSELAAIHLRLGIIAAAEGDAERAEQSFVRLLAVEPEARLPPGMSPFVASAFERARERWGDAELHVAEIEPPALSGDEVAIRLEGRDDRASMVLALRLEWRLASDDAFRTLTALGLGPHRFVLDGATEGSEVEYHASLLGDREGILARLGTPSAPRVATVRARSGAREWYERWYVWAAAGVVVAAVAVGLVFLLRPEAQSYDARPRVD